MDANEIIDGLPVIFWFVIDEKGNKFSPFLTSIRSPVWTISGNRQIVKVKGFAGGVAIEHLELVTPETLDYAETKNLQYMAADSSDFGSSESDKKPDMSTAATENAQLDKQDAYYEPLYSNDSLNNVLWTATAELGADSPSDNQIDQFLDFLWRQGFVVARMDSVRELNEPKDSTVTVADAVNRIASELNSNPDLYHTWQCNLAMTVRDEADKPFFKEAKIDSSILHELANAGAKRFLNLLIEGQK